MDIKATAIPDVKIITPARYGDHRGYFCEVYNRRALAEAGIDIDFVQDNQSFSAERGTLRGLHFQTPPATQSQAPARAARHRGRRRGRLPGRLADLRPARDGRADGGARRPDPLPQGLRPRTLTMEPDTEITYKVDAYYAPDHDLGVRWDDPDLAIDWPIAADAAGAVGQGPGAAAGSATCRRCSPTPELALRPSSLKDS